MGTYNPSAGGVDTYNPSPGGGDTYNASAGKVETGGPSLAGLVNSRPIPGEQQ